MHHDSLSHDDAGGALLGVEETIRSAAARYAGRFGVQHLREEIEAESVARVLALVRQGRPPFDAPVALDGALDRMQRFTQGLVANVAREALRGRVRHAHAPLEDRAAACAALRAGAPAPGEAIELEEAISGALRRFRALTPDVRETIVAEEVMQNDYASDEAGRLCRSCEVSFQRVWQMIENRRSGVWSAEAWRQRVHRSRKKARSAMAGLAPLAIAAALLVGLVAGALSDAGPSEVQRTTTDTPAVHVADDGSTQNGKAPADLRVADNGSTQNGKAPADLRVADNGTQNGKAPAQLRLASTQNGKANGKGSA